MLRSTVAQSTGLVRRFTSIASTLGARGSQTSSRLASHRYRERTLAAFTHRPRCSSDDSCPALLTCASIQATTHSSSVLMTPVVNAPPTPLSRDLQTGGPGLASLAMMAHGNRPALRAFHIDTRLGGAALQVLPIGPGSSITPTISCVPVRTMSTRLPPGGGAPAGGGLGQFVMTATLIGVGLLALPFFFAAVGGALVIGIVGVAGVTAYRLHRVGALGRIINHYLRQWGIRSGSSSGGSAAGGGQGRGATRRGGDHDDPLSNLFNDGHLRDSGSQREGGLGGFANVVFREAMRSAVSNSARALEIKTRALDFVNEDDRVRAKYGDVMMSPTSMDSAYQEVEVSEMIQSMGGSRGKMDFTAFTRRGPVEVLVQYIERARDDFQITRLVVVPADGGKYDGKRSRKQKKRKTEIIVLDETGDNPEHIKTYHGKKVIDIE